MGFLYSLIWELKENWCLYVGNRQGGPINEVDNLNDPVLQGETVVDNILADMLLTTFTQQGAYGHLSHTPQVGKMTQ